MVWGMLYMESNGVVTSTVQTYDSMGRVLISTKEIQGVAYNPTIHLYDLSGNLTNVYYPDRYPVQYTYYQGTALLYRVIGQLGVVLATFSDYAPNGSPCRIDYRNGAYTDQAFDGQTLRLESVTTTDVNSIPVQDFAYTYTPAGNLSTKVDSRDQTVTYTYTYDNLHRMFWEEGTDGTERNIGYDSIGNIRAQIEDDEYLVYYYEENGSNYNQRINSIFSTVDGTYRYCEHDANGAMTLGWDFSDPANPVERTIQYNGDNMPITATLGLDALVFAYDGSGSRAVMEIVGGDVTHYVTGGYEVVDGTPIKYISGGGVTIAKIDENGVMTFMHQDHLGSSTASTDASGAALGGADYRPFGLESSSWGTFTDKYRYTGQEKDFSTGLYNYGARLYDPILGRFISADTLVPNPLNPQSLNRYAYCQNNPLTYVDPTGHERTSSGGLHFEKEDEEDKIPSYEDILYNLVEPTGGFLGPWNLSAEDSSFSRQIASIMAAGYYPVAVLLGPEGEAEIIWGMAVDNSGHTILGELNAPDEAYYAYYGAQGVSWTAVLVALGAGAAGGGVTGGAATESTVQGLFGSVERSVLEAAANSPGGTINVMTKLTQAPQAGRALSVAFGEGASGLVNAARGGGQIFTAQIPQALLSHLEGVGLAFRSTTQMTGGVTATEIRFAPQAADFIVSLFK